MRRLISSAVAVILAAGMSYAGPTLEIGGDSNCWIQVGGVIQPHFLYTDNGTDKEDFFLRRGRIMLTGQVKDGVKWFLETDAPNAGKNGVATSHVDIQDAFLDVRLHKCDLGEQWFKAGFILLPFSFESRAGATSLLGVDYNTEVIKLVNTFVWRDYGAELHGRVTDRFSYILGTYDGYDSAEGSKNPGAALRLTGHIAFNLLGKAEDGWFFSQERLGKGAPYISIGAGGDMQDKATLTYNTVTGTTNKTAVIKDSEAWVIDFQSGFAVKEVAGLGDVNITLNGGYYNWDNVSFKGDTMCVEGGVMAKRTMVTMKYSVQEPDGSANTEDFTAGLHYFLKGHNARAGVEYRWGDSPTTVLAGFQFLL